MSATTTTGNCKFSAKTAIIPFPDVGYWQIVAITAWVVLMSSSAWWKTPDVPLEFQSRPELQSISGFGGTQPDPTHHKLSDPTPHDP